MDVQLVLLRALAGMGAHAEETPLKAGMVLPARVLGGGQILLAGVKLAATLPPGLEPGTFVRVKVQEATTERLLLQVVEQPVRQDAGPAAQQVAQPIPTFPVQLPAAATARLLVDPDEAGEGEEGVRVERHTVTLRYESAGLGRVDLALSLDGAMVRAVAHAPAGEVAERLRSATGDLREALSGALGRPASVDIIAHAETFDAQA